MRGSVSEGTVGCRSAWRPRHLLPDKPGAGQALLFLLNSQMYPPNRVILFMNLKNEVRADSLGTSQWIPPQAQSRGLKLASSRGGRGGGFVKGKHSLRCVSFSNRWEKKKTPKTPRFWSAASAGCVLPAESHPSADRRQMELAPVAYLFSVWNGQGGGSVAAGGRHGDRRDSGQSQVAGRSRAIRAAGPAGRLWVRSTRLPLSPLSLPPGRALSPDPAVRSTRFTS